MIFLFLGGPHRPKLVQNQLQRLGYRLKGNGLLDILKIRGRHDESPVGESGFLNLDESKAEQGRLFRLSPL